MIWTYAVIVLAEVLGPSTVPAQPPPEPTPTVIALRPAAEPVPALKYRLAPERRSLIPGNAALFYHRAIQFVVESRGRRAGAGKESPEERIARWIGGPIQEFPREEARQLLREYQNALKEVELGAQRASCDWELDLRNEGIALLLPEIQEMRSLARLVSLQVRLAILDGKIDEAMRGIETGLVMGRHVSQGPTIIQGLVGVAIDSIMAAHLEELIQVPGTPSLYWALADRPRPFLDMRAAIEGERFVLEKELPDLSELDRGPWSQEQARQFLDRAQRKLLQWTAGEPIPGTEGAIPPGLPGLAGRLGLAAMAAKIYPEARRALLAQGRPEAEVEAMPVIQAAMLYSLQEYQRRRDDSYKWMNLPYWQSYDRVDRPRMANVRDKLSNPLLTMMSLLTPALNAARLASIRLDRRLDAIQCIEAIRLDAASHGNRLPESLAAITEAPVPLDPATGKPFAYRLEGDSAILSAPVPPGGPNHPAYMIHYVLKLVR